jgi:hypothetical protein
MIFATFVAHAENHGMRVLGSIVLSFLAIVTSLLILVSSTCVFASGMSWGLRIIGLIFALLFLAVTIALVKQIVAMNRNQ